MFESLGDSEKDTHAHLKGAMTERLNPDTDKNRMEAREQLMLRGFREGIESVDELARDLERMLDKSSPGLPAEISEAELWFYLMNSLPEKVAFQLVLGDIRKIKMVQYCHKIPQYDGIVIVIKF